MNCLRILYYAHQITYIVHRKHTHARSQTHTNAETCAFQFSALSARSVQWTLVNARTNHTHTHTMCILSTFCKTVNAFILNISKGTATQKSADAVHPLCSCSDGLEHRQCSDFHIRNSQILIRHDLMTPSHNGHGGGSNENRFVIYYYIVIHPILAIQCERWWPKYTQHLICHVVCFCVYLFH